MEIPEFNRHRIHKQLIKIISHIQTARHQLVLCDEHEKVIRNASNIPGIATLQLNFSLMCDEISLNRMRLSTLINLYSTTADTVEKAMDNPNNTAPPIRGKFLEIPGVTHLQRQLIREGHMPYEDNPTHYIQVPTNQNTKPKQPKPVNPDPKKKPKKKRKDMPL